MASTLVLADGVRLATRDDLPSSSREEAWAHIKAAGVHPGYTLKAAHDQAFRYYAEANVHASETWPTFRDLSRVLLGEHGSLLLSFKDDDPEHVAEAPIEAILTTLERHADQLAHDGFVQFGVMTQTNGDLCEVFVTLSKHFKIWFSDERAFAAQMAKCGLPRAERLEFVDEYSRVTTRLPKGRAMQIEDLQQALVRDLASVP